MGTLIKYEFRKSWKMKALVLFITAVLELVFLVGAISKSDGALSISIMGLTFTAICGVFLIGIYGIHVLSKDINTKQSYMLFMTPNSSYKILGAKTLENGLSVILSGVFFITLAILDMVLLSIRYDDFEALAEIISVVFTDGVRDLTTIYTDFAAVLFDLVVFWVFLISMGYLAVVICASVLKGNRFNGLLSLVVFFVIAYIVEDVNDTIEEALAIASKGTVASSIYDVIFYVILTVVMYVITSWIMDNKLSV